MPSKPLSALGSAAASFPKPEGDFQVNIFWISWLMSQFTYKPNWGFSVTPSATNARIDDDGKAWMQVYLHGAMYVENSTAPFKPWDLDQYPDESAYASFSDYDYRTPLYRRPRYMQPAKEVYPVVLDKPVPHSICSEAQFWDWLHKYFIYEMEHHEIDEWFKVDGKAVYDPHDPKKAGKYLEGR